MNAMTKKELAAVAGYTYRRLFDIDKALPEEKKLYVAGEGGKYDLATFVQRWVQYNVEQQTSDIDDLDTVKAIHEKVKTRKTELEVARLEGAMVDVEDVRRLWGDIVSAVVKNLMHLPSRLAPELVMMENVEQIAAKIAAQMREILEQMAETPVPDYAAGKDAEDAADEEA